MQNLNPGLRHKAVLISPYCVLITLWSLFSDEGSPGKLIEEGEDSDPAAASERASFRKGRGKAFQEVPRILQSGGRAGDVLR